MRQRSLTGRDGRAATAGATPRRPPTTDGATTRAADRYLDAEIVLEPEGQLEGPPLFGHCSADTAVVHVGARDSPDSDLARDVLPCPEAAVAATHFRRDIVTPRRLRDFSARRHGSVAALSKR